MRLGVRRESKVRGKHAQQQYCLRFGLGFPPRSMIIWAESGSVAASANGALENFYNLTGEPVYIYPKYIQFLLQCRHLGTWGPLQHNPARFHDPSGTCNSCRQACRISAQSQVFQESLQRGASSDYEDVHKKYVCIDGYTCFNIAIV